MFDELLQLPLFQGITADQLILFAGRFPLHFETIPSKEVLVRSGEVCEELFFIINGRVLKKINVPGTKVVISEEINSPFTTSPISFYGKNLESIASWETMTETKILRVRKGDYQKMVHSNSVMLLSLLSLLANQAQMSTHYALNCSLKDLKARFAFWVLNLTHKEADRIVISGNRGDIALILGVTALTLKKMIDELIENQIVEYADRGICITQRWKIEELIESQVKTT